MITALLSLYSAATLFATDLPPASPHTMPWSNSDILESSAVPIKKPEAIAPFIKAKSAIAVDLQNGLILYEKDIYAPLPIASLTKLMTSVIILEENNLNDIVKVSKQATGIEGSKIWLAPDEKITVENLMYAILIPSANDAAMALAEYNADTIENFVGKMNQKAKELGLVASQFYNPTGLDQTIPDDNTNTLQGSGDNKNRTKQVQNTSTAYDLTLLARYAYGKSFVRRAVVQKEMEISSTNGKLTHKLLATNDLLGSYLKVLGLKTGTTDEAGECLIAIIEDDRGHDILTIVLNSPNRYSETKILADWVFRSFNWS